MSSIKRLLSSAALNSHRPFSSRLFACDPFFGHLPMISDIWPWVLFFTGIGTMVTCVGKFTSVDLGVNSTLLTVLGTVVSLVVSFKTNNSYQRWWDGRSIWSNITTNSRQLAALIWLQVPDALQIDPAKPAEPTAKVTEQDIPAAASTSTMQFAFDNESSPSPSAQGSQSDSLHSFSDMLRRGDTRVLNMVLGKSTFTPPIPRDRQRERQKLEALIEKKSYINLTQAISVALKHSLRGERGPFYSDLYSLIAFLPKYNPSAFPPITREHLLVLWQHGMPVSNPTYFPESIAVPLTYPASNKAHEETLHPAELVASSSAFTLQMVRPKPSGGVSRSQESITFNIIPPGPDELPKPLRPGSGPNKVTVSKIELMPPRHPPAPRVWDLFPPLRIFKIMYGWFQNQQNTKGNERVKGGRRKRGGPIRSEIPQEILAYLSAFVSDLAKRGLLNSIIVGPLMNTIMELQKAVSDLDKLATTPIPAAYSFHLRLTVWAYLFFLPFQIYSYVGWVTIPAEAIASIIFIGLLEIGAEIEMPIGYDQSDLDLDGFVVAITQQLAQCHRPPCRHLLNAYSMSKLNQPFLPSLSLSAPELLCTPEPPHIPTTMGFTAAFPELDRQETSGQPLPKTVRDVEMAPNANWRQIYEESNMRTRDQLEQRTRSEVGVLAL